jgi:hypothetical protein
MRPAGTHQSDTEPAYQGRSIPSNPGIVLQSDLRYSARSRTVTLPCCSLLRRFVLKTPLHAVDISTMESSPANQRKAWLLLSAFIGFEIVVAFLVKWSHATGTAAVFLYLGPVLLVFGYLVRHDV